MIDVFFCQVMTTNLRLFMSHLCLKRWQEEPNVNIISLNPFTLNCTKEEFNVSRRKMADVLATTDPYIVTDDDCLLIQPLNSALDYFERNKNIGLLGIADNRRASKLTNNMEYHDAVGGIRICRKGIIKNWPPQLGYTYDKAHCDAINRETYKTGYYLGSRMNHIGEGFSVLR